MSITIVLSLSGRDPVSSCELYLRVARKNRDGCVCDVTLYVEQSVPGLGFCSVRGCCFPEVKTRLGLLWVLVTCWNHYI